MMFMVFGENLDNDFICCIILWGLFDFQVKSLHLLQNYINYLKTKKGMNAKYLEHIFIIFLSFLSFSIKYSYKNLSSVSV